MEINPIIFLCIINYSSYLCSMEIDLSKYSIGELVELKNEVSNMIDNYKDGYFYICNVRSYGRNWRDNSIHNIHTLQTLCYEYGGEDGIVDVYSNNPDLSMIENYGDLMYITSESDYTKWKNYKYLKDSIPEISKRLDNWENRDNVPFLHRPSFAPMYNREDLDKMVKELADYDMSFVTPTSYKPNEDLDTDDN
jgi:hypothetical protein